MILQFNDRSIYIYVCSLNSPGHVKQFGLHKLSRIINISVGFDSYFYYTQILTKDTYYV